MNETPTQNAERRVIEADRRAAAAKIREYAAGYYNPIMREGFEVAARIAEGWLRPPAGTGQ